MFRVLQRLVVSRRIKLVGAVGIAAGVLVTGSLVGPAFAAPAPSISTAPSAIQAGQTAVITGANFSASVPFVVRLDPSTSSIYLDSSSSTQADGSFTDTVTIPSSVPVGLHTIQVSTSAGVGEVATQSVWINSTGPGGTASVPSITVADFTTAGKGETVVLHGFFPGETVNGGFGSAGSGGPTGVSAVADSAGAVSFTYVYTGTPTPGSYSLSGNGASSTVNVIVAFQVVADPVAPVSTPIAPVATPVAAKASFTG